MKVKLNGNSFYEISSDFGQIDSAHHTPHTGIDLVMNEGTKIFSPTDGTITKIADYGNHGIGKEIVIKTDDGNNLILGHLSDVSHVHVGQRVHDGDLIALSGNTGNSTGAHLHIGLQNDNGQFINPDKFLAYDQGDSHLLILKGGGTKLIEHGDIATVDDNGTGLIGNFRDFMDFIHDVRENGIFHAIYGKSFFEVVKDFFAQLFHDIGVFILKNGDFFFLMPAIIIMFGTFLIGRNKYTKFIIPLWLAYFMSSFFYKVMTQ